MTPTAPAPETREAVSKIERRSNEVVDKARDLKIATQNEANAAARFLNEIINPLIKEGDELFDPLIAAAYQTHQMALAAKRKAVGSLPDAKRVVRTALAQWDQHLDDLQRIEDQRIEREARERAAVEIEQNLEALDTTTLDPVEAEAEVRAIIEAPRALEREPSAPVPRTEGFSPRFVYTVTVVNLREFYKSIVDGRTPFTLAKPEQSVLNRMAASLKEGFNVPGCQLNKTKDGNSAPSRRAS